MIEKYFQLAEKAGYVEITICGRRVVAEPDSEYPILLLESGESAGASRTEEGLEISTASKEVDFARYDSLLNLDLLEMAIADL